MRLSERWSGARAHVHSTDAEIAAELMPRGGRVKGRINVLYRSASRKIASTRAPLPLIQTARCRVRREESSSFQSSRAQPNSLLLFAHSLSLSAPLCPRYLSLYLFHAPTPVYTTYSRDLNNAFFYSCELHKNCNLYWKLFHTRYTDTRF